jgi:hypothetical protein
LRNINPAACPTLSASSGVITPLARPRIPSVPKYLTAIVLLPRRAPCPQVGGYYEILLINVQKMHASPTPSRRAAGLIKNIVNSIAYDDV